MKLKARFCGVLVLLNLGMAAFGQGTFQNLDFESATLPQVPTNQAAFLPFADVFPGWVGYIGTNQATTAIYNGVSLGSSAITLIKTNTSGVGQNVIAGSYTATLATGADFIFNQGITFVALAQTSLVPVSAQQLRFGSSPLWQDSVTNLRVSFNGQDLPFFPLTDQGNYIEYWADISAFAGLTGELRFAEYPITRNDATVFLDRISYSSIPEPGVIGLIGLSALVFGRCFFRKSRS